MNNNTIKELDSKEIQNIQLKDSNNMSKDLNISKEKSNFINFENLYADLRESENDAIQARIETYELKGFNAMEPLIKNNEGKKKEKISIGNLLDNKNIDENRIKLMKIEKKKFEDKLHYIKIKIEQNDFNKIYIDECDINEYGNINLINCIYMLLQKDVNYFQNLFTKFDIENNIFEIKCYQNGQEEKYLFDNKVIKNTKFIKPGEKNLWIYMVEKALAMIYKHYINTYNLLSSEIFQNLSPFNIKVLKHVYYEKKEIFNEIKNNLNNKNILFSEIDPLNISSIDNIDNLFTSFYINNIFKLNGRKYLELFLPYNTSNEKNEIKIYHNIKKEEINEEDLKNEEYFPQKKIKDSHYYFLSLDTFLINFQKTYILEYSKNFFYTIKKVKIPDTNIDFLKFRVSGGRGVIKLCIKFNFPRCYLCRCILAKLTITENFIRNINTMTSNKSQDNDNDADFIDQTDYDFEYLDGFYCHGLTNIFDTEVENGTYCLLYNVYSNNGFELNISILSYSEGANVEFLDTVEKISGEKLNTQIKSLFISYMKKNMYNNVIKKRIIDNAFSYQSLYNEKIGYSIFMIQNTTEKYYILVDVITENTGMNLITKEYENETVENLINANSKLIKIVVPPKNTELIIFEWEKSIDNIYINLNTNITAEKIENPFNYESFSIDNYNKKYTQDPNVYLIEIPYRKGVFVIFVNESEDNDYYINLSFDNIFNLRYKNYENDDLKNEDFLIKVKKKNYSYLKMKVVNEGEYGYNINLKIKKINK